MFGNAAYPSTELKRAGSLADWNRVVEETFSNTHVSSNAGKFSGYLGRCRIDNLQLMRIRAQSSRVQKQLRDKNKAPSGMMLLHLQSAGTSLTAQDKKQGRIVPGEALLCSPDTDYSVDFETPYEMFVMNIPVTEIMASLPGLDLSGAVVKRLDIRRTQLLLSFLRTAWGQLDCLDHDPDWRDCVSRTSVDLALRAILCSDDMETPSNRQLCGTVLTYIRDHLTDPDLRTAKIAAALGVSSRTVQTVFERMATTASAYILSQRLKLAATWLRGGNRSVTDIAFDAGFNDAAYFSRCFHKQYGLPPRAYGRG